MKLGSGLGLELGLGLGLRLGLWLGLANPTPNLVLRGVLSDPTQARLEG